MPKDLKSFLSQIEKDYPGEFLRVSRVVDPNQHEVSAVLEHLDRKGECPIVFFQRPLALNGQVSQFPLVYNVFGPRERCATAINFPREQSKMPLSIEFARREKQRIKPQVIRKGEAPVKEVVVRDVDLTILPMACYHEMDVGPYLVMTCIMKDPETGVYDVSFCKNLFLGPRRLTASITGPHLTRIHEAYEALGRRAPIAIVLGHHPAFYLGACAITDFLSEDYETIGAFLEEPLRLVPSETWGEDFLVPADAEVIIEGEIPPGEREWMNPFGEISRTYQARALRPVVEVKAMTHRREAIMQGIFPGHEEHFNLGGIPKEGSLYNRLKEIDPGVKAVHFPHSGSSRMICYISMKKKQEGQAKRVALYPISFWGHQVQLSVVVDEDIDVFNEEEVIWSIVMNCRPSRDFEIIKNVRSMHAFNEKIAIDATRPLDVEVEPKSSVPKSALDKVVLSEWIEGYE